MACGGADMSRGVLAGTRNGRLSREVVLQIRHEAGSKKLQQEWAERLGMSVMSIYAVFTGFTYAHIVERSKEKPQMRPIRPKRYTTWGLF